MGWDLPFLNNFRGPLQPPPTAFRDAFRLQHCNQNNAKARVMKSGTPESAEYSAMPFWPAPPFEGAQNGIAQISFRKERWSRVFVKARSDEHPACNTKMVFMPNLTVAAASPFHSTRPSAIENLPDQLQTNGVFHELDHTHPLRIVSR